MITVQTIVRAPIDRVWEAWTSSVDIIQWNHASDDWQCPIAEIELTEGGTFNYRMESKDGLMRFDFEGTFTQVDPKKKIEYKLADNRKVEVRFQETLEGVKVSEAFETDDEMSGEQQRLGWQAILENFRQHVELDMD